MTELRGREALTGGPFKSPKTSLNDAVQECPGLSRSLSNDLLAAFVVEKFAIVELNPIFQWNLRNEKVKNYIKKRLSWGEKFLSLMLKISC